MTAAIASLFRKLNTQMLYQQGIANRLLKGTYFVSVHFFKWWVKRKTRSRTMTIRNYDGDMKMQVDLSKTMGAAIFWTGFHEFNEMRFLNGVLKDDMTFVDIGANQGEYTLFAAKRLSRGRVLAFEPVSFFFDRLRHNVDLNNLANVRCFPLGLSDRAESVPIYFNAENPENHEGLASLFPLTSTGEQKETITLRRLDDVVEEERVTPIHFIKVDVEGSEWAALRGAEKVLRRDRPVLMVELNEETASKAGFKVDEMLSWLAALGYEPFRIGKHGLQRFEPRLFCNAIFVPRKNSDAA